MTELKPCPFCGGKDSGMLTTSYDGYWFAVLREAWNRRTDSGNEMDL